MLQLLSPLSLFALAALLAPIVIHLLSRKSGKRIKVGSIKFLVHSESRSLKSLKLNELALLLLRCALLALLALLLAQPQWLGASRTSESRGWVLVAPELYRIREVALQRKLDTLAAAGHELRAFASDFPFLNADTAHGPRENYWSLLRELETRVPPNMPVWIFSSDELRNFRGARPASSLNIVWQNYSAAEPNQWIHSAKHLNADSVQLLVGWSGAQRTRFARYTLPAPSRPTIFAEGALPPVEIILQKNGHILRLAQRDARPADDSIFVRQPAALKTITIYFDKPREEDARYLQAALAAVSGFAAASWQIRSEMIAGNGAHVDQSAFLFWLAEQPAPKKFFDAIANGAALFTDAGARPYQTVVSEIVTSVSLSQTPRLWCRVSQSGSGLVLWRDGWGEALLQAERIGMGWRYQFHSRFHSQWNELVLHPAFPELLLQLVEPRDDTTPALPSERRQLSAAQILPQKKSVEAHADKPAHATDLRFPLWLLAALIFAWERWLSERRSA